MSKTINVTGTQDVTYVASAADTTYRFTASSDISVAIGTAIDATSGAKNRNIEIDGSVNADKGGGVEVGASGKGAGDLVIGATGHIEGLSGVFTLGVGQTIENNGTIEGSSVGLQTNGDNSVVSNAGSISSDDWGAAIVGTHSVLHNTGNIDGKMGGVNLAGEHGKLVNDFHIGSSVAGAAVRGWSDAVIINHADIDGVNGVSFLGDASSVNRIVNSGHLEGFYYAVAGSDGRDIVRNTGDIKGIVDLGDGNDVFKSSGTLDGSVVGGNGNDTYIVNDATIQMSEDLQGGRDTVRSSVSFTLADNFEVLQLTGKADTVGVGNAAGNRLIGNSGDNLLGGDAGNDHLTGHGGADTFVFKTGDNHDAITDFQVSGSDHDVAALLVGGIASFADLKSHMSQHGDDVLLTFDNGDSLTLRHVAMHDLKAADFSFS
jgi:Ca2+-binding RTX toxin-like protein